MNTRQSGIKINGSPHLRAQIARNRPIALEPASPIISLLGVALNHRYASRTDTNIRIIGAKELPMPTF